MDESPPEVEPETTRRISRGWRIVIGVLVVQNRTRRQYTSEEIETLETIAMVTAEMIATAEVADDKDRAEIVSDYLPMKIEEIEKTMKADGLLKKYPRLEMNDKQ